MTMAPGIVESYPGGKAGAGVHQRIVSMMPAHSVYVEAFLGNGAVLRSKLPAADSVGIDVDRKIIAQWEARGWPGLTLHRTNGIHWLATHALPDDAVVFCDPPYLPETRRKQRIYPHEMSYDDHALLLTVIAHAEYFCIITGYDSELYRDRLQAPRWHCTRHMVQGRGGAREECIWHNFEPAQTTLHDVRKVGTNFRDRLRIKRKASRWAANFAALPPHERQAILAALAAVPLHE